MVPCAGDKLEERYLEDRKSCSIIDADGNVWKSSLGARRQQSASFSLTLSSFQTAQTLMLGAI